MSNKRNRLTRLSQNGKEPGYIGFRYDITNEQSVPGLQIAPKATKNGKEPGYIGFRYDITNEQSVPGLQIAPKATIYYPEFGTWKTAYIPLWW